MAKKSAKKDNWIADAITPATEGAFSGKAKKAGKTTHQMAVDVADNPKASTKTKRQAALALTLEKLRSRKKGKTGK